MTGFVLRGLWFRVWDAIRKIFVWGLGVWGLGGFCGSYVIWGYCILHGKCGQTRVFTDSRTQEAAAKMSPFVALLIAKLYRHLKVCKEP